MGNLNWLRAIGAVRAAGATMAAYLSRAARERFTADGLLRTQTNDHCALARIRAFASRSPIGPSPHFVATQQFSRFWSEADVQRAALTEPDL
jgi:hypothetical protein